MGEVWRAEHVNLGTPCAIKVIVDAEFGESNPRRAELVGRFFREAHAAASLRSPHVVQIFDHGDDGVPYIAMELLEGETLEQRLERERTLSPRKTAEVITHIARAVGKAHEAGIVHRDLKPGNVFLVRNDDQEIAKVLDFGIAKLTSNGAGDANAGVMTRTGSVVGTPCYMSPEQALGNKTIDLRSDLWALAVIAFECLVGKRPFDGDALGVLIVEICTKPIPIPSQSASVPEGFDAWFAKAASREPSGRYPSAKAMAEALREVLAVDSIRMTQPSISVIGPAQVDAMAQTATHQRTHPGVVAAINAPTRRRTGPALVVGAVGLAALVGVGVFVGLRGSVRPPPEPVAISSSTIPDRPATARGAAGSTATVESKPAVTPSTSATTAAAPPVLPTASAKPAFGKPVSGKPVSGKPVSGKPPVVAKPADRLGF